MNKDTKKEKREFLFQVEVKRASDGKHFKLKRYVEIELNWNGNQGKFVKTFFVDTEYYPKGDVIAFSGGQGEEFNYRFRVKNLEVVKDWKKDFFKDKVINWKLEPIQDEISEKITTYWGDRVDATQYRASRILVVGTAFLLLVGGILVWFLWRRKRK